jgi:hypothetical protein
MVIEAVDINGDLFHGGVCFGNACGLVDNAAFDILDIGGDLADAGCSFRHIGDEFATDVREGNGLLFDDNDKRFDFAECGVEISGEVADFVFGVKVDRFSQIALAFRYIF